KDIGPSGSLLVGLEVGLGRFVNNDTVIAVRPIYRVGDKESLGDQYGTDTSRPVKVVAKPGYAVGALTLRTGLGLDGFSLTFMKVVDGKLDPNDSYESDWIGGPGGFNAVKIDGDGKAVTGLLGRTNDKNVAALGLAYVGEKPWPPGKPTRVQGGGDLENRDGAPAGGLLVGFEIGLGKWFNNDVVKAIRPIYRVGDKESFGERYGTDTSRVVKVVAKPGYAVGAIMIKTGLGIDGMSVIFMKVADGKLDPKENYESEWIGGMGGGGLVRITGEGKLVIGSVVKTNAKDATGIGLLLQDADKK
ncbi:MAG TPA: hypothetical protein VLM40_10915, partial [Gemmata sp.]|nr:hypothetical protein [Gemmata sp.]